MNDSAHNEEKIPFGAPGMPPRWTSGAKDGLITANSSASPVWATISHGIVNEVYYPTIDRPQVRDLQLIITDGESFVHDEQYDLTHETACVPCEGGASLAYRTINSDPGGRYRIIKEVFTNPEQPCLLVNVHLDTLPEWQGRLQAYVLLAPHLDGGGWNNSARSRQVAGQAVLLAWKKMYLALAVDTGFLQTSCGYVGFSDGWQDLKKHLRMTWKYDAVLGGNIALIGQIDLNKGMDFTLALGFGDHAHAAITTVSQTLSVPAATHREKFLSTWHEASAHSCPLPGYTGDNGLLYRISHNILLAHEDKTYRGAFIASASIPWGDVQEGEVHGGYHLVWSRDMVQTALALLVCGDTEHALRALVYLACLQQVDGGFPQNSWLNGEPYWTGIQLDEVAFPIILAWRLWKMDGLQDFDPYPMVRAGAAFLIRQGPATQQERWEEVSGYSPSTLAASIAALVCAADFARNRHDQNAARFMEEYADFLESHIERWTVTEQGTLLPGVNRHYIRILPTAIDNLEPMEDPNDAFITLANQPPDGLWRFPVHEIVDAGFLELVRYGIRSPADPLIEDSLRVVDAALKVDTPWGPCWRRYPHDGYGDKSDGGPFLGWGKGRAWPLLTGERGHYELAAGRDPMPYIHAMEGFASSGGLLPEQVWDEDRPDLQIRLGQPARSAMPLAWAHAEYIKLVRSTADGQVFDGLPPVANRYLVPQRPPPMECWKPVRQIQKMVAGQILRVMAPAAFRLRWTIDEWQLTQETLGISSGLGIHFVDIALSTAQSMPVRFIFRWLENAQYPFFRCRVNDPESPEYRIDMIS